MSVGNYYVKANVTGKPQHHFSHYYIQLFEISSKVLMEIRKFKIAMFLRSTEKLCEICVVQDNTTVNSFDLV